MLKVDPVSIKERLDQLATERYQWESIWQDVIDYMLPNRSPVRGTITPGEDRSVLMYDSTAYKSLLRLSANLNDMLTNQSSQWFQLGIDDKTLSNDPSVQSWLMETTEQIRKYLDGSNFYDQIHELYMDLGSFGTAIMYVEDSNDSGKYLNFKTCHIREIYLDENKYGAVDTVFREFIYTARQCYQRWGDKISDVTMDKYENDPTFETTIIHACFPRDERDPKSKDNLNMEFASVWMEKDNMHILDEGGYETFPYLVPRWMKSSGERFGRSPALASLADIKTLNAMMETTLIAGQMAAEPPLQVPDDAFMSLNVAPGGISYYRAGTNDYIRPLETGKRLPLTFDMAQEKRDSIADAFFATQLQVIDKSEMTAQEVRARMSENMRVIGPTVGRLQNELLSVLIFRVLNILNYSVDENGQPVLPIPPESVQGKEYSLKYVSPLAKAKRHNELQAINSAVGTAFQWAQAGKPEVLDNLNIDVAYRRNVDISGAPVDILVDEKKVQANRKARAEQMAQAQQLQQSQGQAEVAETASKAGKNLKDARG
ncbi:MAG: hypothetical protein DRJ03_18220 [Chloroflexi bacterium]|nr:MAG: hypothetical protein DRJ03_18220 [Chloroflexota bacterium]